MHPIIRFILTIVIWVCVWQLFESLVIYLTGITHQSKNIFYGLFLAVLISLPGIHYK